MCQTVVTAAIARPCYRYWRQNIKQGNVRVVEVTLQWMKTDNK